MCQLLGMNCNTPTDICFSFAGFQARGGLTDEHRDGWGIAFFEGTGCRLFVDAQATVASPIAELVRNYPIRSTNVIAHIRKATQGAIGLENTHPFQRELWGRYWIFAHNGNLVDYSPKLDGSFLPVGRTDSERAFCAILQSLRAEFGNALPGDDSLFDAIARLATRIGEFGEFNFLLSNGDSLFAHCASRLTWLIRQAPFAAAHLTDQDLTVDFSEVTTPEDRVAVVATTPLTDNEAWHVTTPGTLMQLAEGALVRSIATRAYDRTGCGTAE